MCLRMFSGPVSASHHSTKNKCLAFSVTSQPCVALLIPVVTIAINIEYFISMHMLKVMRVMPHHFWAKLTS